MARIDDLQAARQQIVRRLKLSGPRSADELATDVSLSHQAVRKHINKLVDAGWVTRLRRVEPSGGVGRPASTYALTAAGEHLFPKAYDELSGGLIAAVLDEFGREGLRAVLGRIVERRTAELEPGLEGKSLEDRIAALDGVYWDRDPWFRRVGGESFEAPAGPTDEAEGFVEMNCPYLSAAMAHPEVCSCTVNILSRLLGRRVERERSFQAGDGCCLFRVRPDASPGRAEGFVFESEIAISEDPRP